MADKAKAEDDDKSCACLKCRLRDAILAHFAAEHGDAPGDVVICLNEALGCLGRVAAELFSTYELDERLERICEWVAELANASEHIHSQGQAPPVIDEGEPGEAGTVH